MKCLVLFLIVVACVQVSVAAVTSCLLSQDFFSRYNVSADGEKGPGPICGGQCCGRGQEDQLKIEFRRVAQHCAADVTRPTAELLLSTQRTLREHLLGLSHQSQNKTALLFTRVYRGHAIRTYGSLTLLYEDIRTLLRSNNNGDVMNGDLGTPPPKDLAASTKKFFRDIFPVAYQNVLRLDSKQFTPEYEACLKDAYEAVEPFGDIPQQLATTLTRSLGAARALLQVLAVGAGALAASEQVLSRANDDCAERLVRVGACARCNGHDVPPCRNYCLNVVRDCLGSLVADLEAPWSSYVERVERVTRTDADSVLRSIDEKVSKAYMNALENHLVLEKKVRQECGPPTTIDAPGIVTTRAPPSSRRDALRAPPPDAELLQFAASLSARKKLFAGIADRLCYEPDFASDSDDQCWNGEEVGEYSKPLVASALLSDQRYNPETSGGNTMVSSQNAGVAAIGDRLLQARQLLVETWGDMTPPAESFMQGDEADFEGSGSGRSYSDDDAVDDEGSGDDGSGDEDIRGRSNLGEGVIDTTTPKIKGAVDIKPLVSITLALAVFTIIFQIPT